MSVIRAYRELGHLVGGGRLETWATNSKLTQKRRRRERGDDLLVNESDYPLHTKLITVPAQMAKMDKLIV